MKVIMQHPTGNANVRAAALGLAQKHILENFYTSVAAFPGNIFDRISAIGPFSEFSRRRFEPELEPITSVWPWKELIRIAAGKIGFTSLIKHETGLFCVDAVYQSLDKRVASSLQKASANGVNAIYSYEDGAAISFRRAKEIGMLCLYDLPIGYWRSARRLLQTELQRRPEWSATMTGFLDSPAKLARKDEELRMADHIFVASSFTASTLQDYPGKLGPIHVIPYGFPAVNGTKDYSGVFSRPLKLLFVGGLSQRKGIGDLFAAVEAIGAHVTLTVVGRKSGADCSALNTALDKHRWIPTLPHNQILQLMREHDVLVFPSHFEGFGLVITEAMSQGTPVITTERTAGPDLITHDQNGWLIRAGSTLSLQETIENLLQNPSEIKKAGKEAMETARRRPWEVYGRELAEKLLEINM